ncbi:unnamed protein product [Rangifer tarandus platyrhynchus]|uniref:Uncharacterized protein n=1 Tax=Rangifer tarandus platyrhynchus TaxID=3082113 RepID=A0ABN8Z525_RANTA|nr:unnamed protein product [Rangifer tarandus platyrhynchus]
MVLRAGPDTHETTTTPVSLPMTRPPEARTGSEPGLGPSTNETKRLDRGRDRQKCPSSQLWRGSPKLQQEAGDAANPLSDFGQVLQLVWVFIVCVSERGGGGPDDS